MADLHFQTKKGDLKLFQSVDELSASLAAYVAELSDAAIRERGRFSVVLSGGSLIDELRNLTEAPYPDSVDWKQWRVFWVDERVVPKTHPDSNYKLAMDGLLSKPVPIIDSNFTDAQMEELHALYLTTSEQWCLLLDIIVDPSVGRKCSDL